MAGKGYGADATLVAAAYRLGQSYVPGDYSKIFEKQYEGLIAANKAKAQAKIDFSKNLTENLGDFMESKKEQEEEDQEIIDNFKELNEIGNTYTDHMTTEFAEDMEGGNSLPSHQFDAAEFAMENTVNEYEGLSKITFPTKEQKKDKRRLKKEMLEFRPAIVKSRADQSTKATLWANGGINKDLSFKEEPNLQALYSLSIDKNKTTEQLKSMGIKTYWKNNKKYYEYPDGLYGAIYGDISNGGADGVDVIPTDTKQKYTITETDLLARLIPKDTKTEGDLNAIGTELLKDINKTTTNPDNGAKVRTIKDFDSKRDKVYGKFKATVLLSENPSDIYTREHNIGDTARVYANDLQSNRNIDEAVINQMGIGSDVFTKEELEDGVIDPTELAKHKNAKDKIMEILTNPKTAEQKEIAAEEYAKYRTDMLGNVFDAERTRIDGASSGGGGGTISKFETFLGNTVEIPTTQGAKEDKALIENIAADSPTVTVNGVEYKRVNGAGYDYRAIKDKGGKITSGGDEVTKEYLIRSVSDIYGKINDGYFGESTYKMPKVKYDPSSNQTTVEQMKAALPKGTNLDRSDEEIRKAYKKYVLSLAK